MGTDENGGVDLVLAGIFKRSLAVVAFLVPVTKCLVRSNLMEGFILDHRLREIEFILVGKTQWQKHETVGHIASEIRKPRR